MKQLFTGIIIGIILGVIGMFALTAKQTIEINKKLTNTQADYKILQVKHEQLTNDIKEMSNKERKLHNTLTKTEKEKEKYKKDYEIVKIQISNLSKQIIELKTKKSKYTKRSTIKTKQPVKIVKKELSDKIKQTMAANRNRINYLNDQLAPLYRAKKEYEKIIETVEYRYIKHDDQMKAKRDYTEKLKTVKEKIESFETQIKNMQNYNNYYSNKH